MERKDGGMEMRQRRDGWQDERKDGRINGSSVEGWVYGKFRQFGTGSFIMCKHLVRNILCDTLRLIVPASSVLTQTTSDSATVSCLQLFQTCLGQ